MAYKIHHWILKVYHTMFYGCLDVLNVNCIPPCFKLNEWDGEFFLEAHLVICSDAINLSIQLIYNAVYICDASGGGLSFSIR